MGKIQLPFMIKAVSGRVGDTVYYMRGGRQMARRHVLPRNPSTPAQARGRSEFARLARLWRDLPREEKEAWRLKAGRSGLTGYNLYIREGLRAGKRPANAPGPMEPQAQQDTEAKWPGPRRPE